MPNLVVIASLVGLVKTVTKTSAPTSAAAKVTATRDR